MGRIFRHSLIHFVEGMGKEEEEEEREKKRIAFLCIVRSVRKRDNKAACLR